MVVPYSGFFHLIQNGFHWSGDERKAASGKLLMPEKLYSDTDANSSIRFILPSDSPAITRHVKFLSQDYHCDWKFAGLVGE